MALAAAAAGDGDRYLAELLHDEAVRAAVLARLTAETTPDVSAKSNTAAGPQLGMREVETYLEERAQSLDLIAGWRTLEERWPDLSKRRRTILADVAKRLRTRELSWE